MSPFTTSAIFSYLAKATACVALACTASLSTAGILTVNSNTAFSPTWHRTNSGVPPTVLSAVGAAVRYKVTPFHVNNSGLYTLLNTSTYDNYLHLYVTAFNPASQFTNVIAADDDAGPGSNALLTNMNLSAGINYFAVSSSFANQAFGPFALSIQGLGSDLATLGSANGNNVPEPGSLALLGLALMGLVAARRRKTL